MKPLFTTLLVGLLVASNLFAQTKPKTVTKPKTINEINLNVDTATLPHYSTSSYSCDDPQSSGYANVKFFFGTNNIYVNDRNGFRTYQIKDVSKNEWGSTVYVTVTSSGVPFQIKVMKSNYGDTAIQTMSTNGITLNYFNN